MKKVVITLVILSILAVVAFSVDTPTYIYSKAEFCVVGTSCAPPVIPVFIGGGRILCPENMIWDHTEGQCVPIVLVTPSEIEVYISFDWDIVKRRISLTNRLDRDIMIELVPTEEWISIEPASIILYAGYTTDVYVTISNPKDIFAYIEIYKIVLSGGEVYDRSKITEIKVTSKKIDTAGFHILIDFLKNTNVPLIIITGAGIIDYGVPLFYIIAILLILLGIYEYKKNRGLSILLLLLAVTLLVVCLI